MVKPDESSRMRVGRPCFAGVGKSGSTNSGRGRPPCCCTVDRRLEIPIPPSGSSKSAVGKCGLRCPFCSRCCCCSEYRDGDGDSSSWIAELDIAEILLRIKLKKYQWSFVEDEEMKSRSVPPQQLLHDELKKSIFTAGSWLIKPVWTTLKGPSRRRWRYFIPYLE